MTPTSRFDPFKSFSKWIFLLMVVGLVGWNTYWLFTLEPEHDEVEHWHAAWLMHEGKQPFFDFFEHHAPVFWMLLSPYYSLFGENYGIIFVSRGLLFIIFLLIIFVTYRTARQWISPQGSGIAAVGFLLFSVDYLRAHTTVRGDPLILLFLMLALYIAIPLAEKKPWGGLELRRLWLFFCCLALAVVISPRAGIPALTAFLALGILGLGALPFRRLVLTFLGGGVLILLPTLSLALIYGFESYFFWVYKFSGWILPVHSPLGLLLHLVKAALPMWILVAFGWVRVLGSVDLKGRRSRWLLIAMCATNFAGLWASRHPYMQHFLMAIPFLGLAAGLGYDQLLNFLRKRTRLFNWNVAAVALFLGLLLLTTKTAILRPHRPEATCRYWVERAAWLVQHTDKQATVAGGVAFVQPIFRHDAFYYWFAARYAIMTLENLREDFQRYTFEQLRQMRPTILHESFTSGWDIDQDPRYQEWLGRNYEETPWQGYFLLKDSGARIQNSE